MSTRAIRSGSKRLLLLLAVGLGWTACSSDLTPGDPSRGGAQVLMVDATKGSQSLTRGLTDNLQAIWSEGDVVTVLAADGSQIGSMTPLVTGSARTRLQTSLSAPVALGDALTLVLPRVAVDYTGQVGTIADIAARYDYASAAVRIRYIEDAIVSATNAVFESQQAIVRFSLMNGSTPLQASSLTVSADGLKQSATATGDITITPASATNVVYAALSGVNGKVTLTASVGNEVYTYTTANSLALENGAYYPITVYMKPPTDPALGEPLTLEALGDGTQITFTNKSTGIVQFSRNLSDWNDIAAGESRNISPVNAGEKVYFRGNNVSYYPESDPSSITCTDPCYVYGNLLSLVSATAFESLTSLPEGENTFRSLFEGNTFLRNHPDKELLLPATTLKPHCYERLFAGCTGLSRAPELPAPTLRANCYQAMFEGCTSLSYIKCLATNLDPVDCTTNWLLDVSPTGTFVKAPAMTTWPTGPHGIPPTWTIQ